MSIEDCVYFKYNSYVNNIFGGGCPFSDKGGLVL